MRTLDEARTLADARVTEIAGYAGDVMYLVRFEDGWEGTAASSLVSAVTCARCIRNRVPRSDKGA